MFPHSTKLGYSTICVYSFIYSLTNRQGSLSINTLRQKSRFSGAASPPWQVSRAAKKPLGEVQLSPSKYALYSGTATLADISEKFNMQRIDKGPFKHKMNESEHQRTATAEPPFKPQQMNVRCQH